MKSNIKNLKIENISAIFEGSSWEWKSRCVFVCVLPKMCKKTDACASFSLAEGIQLRLLVVGRSYKFLVQSEQADGS